MKAKNIRACDHIGILTNNHKRLLIFYKKLGFKQEKNEILDATTTKEVFDIKAQSIFVRLVLDNVKVELFEPITFKLDKKYSGTAGLHHWGFWVGDLKAFLRKLKKKDIDIIEVKRGRHSAYFIEDPDKNRIEVRGYA